LYVLGFTKNLISVSTLEDKEFEVTFCGGKVYIRPKGSTTKMDKVIGVRSEKVYRLHFEPTKALVNNNTDLSELWHRQMARLHFGALGHLRQTVTRVPQVTVEKHDPCKGCALGKYARKGFSVDRPFSNGGQLTCREDASSDANLMKTVMVLLGYLIPQQNFCKRNFRTPAWVDNVISLHGS
jgi:hypothetical protein